MKAILLPSEPRETLAFPDTAGDLESLTRRIESLSRDPAIEEIVVACEAERYRQAVEWLNSQISCAVTLRIVKVGDRPHLGAALKFLFHELQLDRKPQDVAIMAFTGRTPRASRC